MSDYLHYTLDFILRADCPAALTRALSALAARQLPDQTDLDRLPPVVAYYLGHPDPPRGVPGDGFTTRLSPAGPPSQTSGHLRLHFERSFHDDEAATAGLCLVTWLCQYALHDGYLGTVRAEYRDLPGILVRADGVLIETGLHLAPANPHGLHDPGTPIDGYAPVVTGEVTRLPIDAVLDTLDDMPWP